MICPSKIERVTSMILEATYSTGDEEDLANKIKSILENEMSQFTQYEHHEKMVWVRKSLQGQHRQHNLCFSCKTFKPDHADNCERAKRVYNLCVKLNMSTPVFECPEFKEK